MRHSLVSGLLAVLLLDTVIEPLPAQTEKLATSTGTPSFILRATSRWASVVNKVLSQVAQPVELIVPVGEDAAGYLARTCAGTPPPAEPLEADGTAARIRTYPCVRVQRNVRVEVTTGDTCEGLSVRHGLPPAAADRLQVVTSTGAPQCVERAESLQIGDVVLVPEVPIWSTVVARQGTVTGLADMIATLAVALDCGKEEEPATCVRRREITVLERAAGGTRTEPNNAPAPVAPPASAPTALPVAPPAPAPTPSPFPEQQLNFISPLSVTEVARREVDGTATTTLTTAALSASTARIPVHRDQWPYDVNLLAAIVSDARDKFDADATIGIADGGLADADGMPLPRNVFAPAPEKREERPAPARPEPNEADSDGNDYLDDLYGAGLRRPGEDLGELLGTGDMGLCKGARPWDGWSEAAREKASHGSIVSSIAAALSVRAVDNALNVMPKLVFFRMADACDAQADLNVKAGDLVLAFDYLQKRRPAVVNISYDVDDEQGRQLRDNLKPLLPQLSLILFLAAGNKPIDLDLNGAVCPACLGHSSEDRGGSAAKRTIVVGAATRQLQRVPGTAWGRDTVKLFAPGDPRTGIDLLSRPAGGNESTSYAAPYASLAAAMLWSLGIQYWADLRDRLEATVWPLYDAASSSESTGIGVVDLVKAAAVKHDAIEVIEPDMNGVLGRRTYVGTLLTDLDGQVCPGYSLTRVRFHALRLEDPAPDGRAVRAYHRAKEDPAAKHRKKVDVLPDCRPAGQIEFQPLKSAKRTFDLDNMTAIQFRW